MVASFEFQRHPDSVQEVQKIKDAGVSTISKSTPVGEGVSKISKDFVTHFMRERDYPNWFRGLSFSQMNAADSLLNNIRDDSEQNTVHRVCFSLQRLGIHPLVSPKKIKLAMRLSRGNDIAFLWFLMELYYRGTQKQGEYSLNEQIVMSAICHLDAIPTLRELDRLLPKQPDRPKVVKPTKALKKKTAYLLPYFEKQVRPIPFGKRLTLSKVNNNVNLEYGNYLNPNYIVPNESSRWFANYELNEGKRLAKGIIDDQLQMIFSENADNDVPNSLCAHHEFAESVKASLSRKLAVMKRDICQRCLDIEGGVKSKAYKRITAFLNQRIEEAEQEFRRITKSMTKAKNMCASSYVQKEENGKVSFDLTDVNSTKSLQSKPSVIEEEENLDFGHADQRHSKHIYFQAPTAHTPYKFNYAEIFEMGARNLIKESIHYSLGGSRRDVSIDHTERIRALCKDLWEASVEEYQREQSVKAKVEAKSTIEGKDQPVTYYDPNNQGLMLKMLLDAITEMKKNKKFVLATFPDAHKTPFLKEFIRKRYGFVYTRDSKRMSFQQSKLVFHVLKRTEIRAKIPTADDVAAKRVVSYACKDYIQKKTNYLVERFNRSFKLALMEHARNYWGAVRPYQCLNGPPRNEFFAYLPSRENDIHMFRPWKPNEFIKAKEEWTKRQRIKRTKLFG